MILDKELQVTHLKRWTFWGLVKTDILDRGIPWTELILRDRYMPNDLNLELSQRVSVALAFLLLGICVAAAIYWRGYFLTPLLALLIFLLSQYWLESASGPRSKPVLITLGLCVGADRLAGARAPYELASRRRCCWAAFSFPASPLRLRVPTRRRKLTGIILATYILGATAYMVAHLPNHYLIFAFFVMAALIVILNNQFYLFLAAKRGRLFALAACPLPSPLPPVQRHSRFWRGSRATPGCGCRAGPNARKPAPR